VDGKKMLVLPDVEWNRLNLKNLDSYMEKILANTNKSADQPGFISKQTACDILDTDYQKEQSLIRQSMIDDAIMAKEKEILNGAYTLEELRALNPEEDIEEREIQPSSDSENQDGSGAQPGMDMGGLGEIGGGDMGGMGGMGDLDMGGEGAPEAPPIEPPTEVETPG